MTTPSNALRPSEAEAVWQVLVDEAGASPVVDPTKSSHWTERNWRHSAFLRYVCVNEPFGHEFRFEGSLGFGGKFLNDGRRWVVTCYPEDRTPERDAAIERTNARLLQLRNDLGVDKRR